MSATSDVADGRSARPRLQLKPRDPNAAKQYDIERARTATNPFGAAKPRELIIAEREGKTVEEVLREAVKKERPKLRLAPEQLEQRQTVEGRIAEVREQLQEADESEKPALLEELGKREAALEELLDGFEALALEAAQRGEIQRPSERRQQQQQMQPPEGADVPRGRGVYGGAERMRGRGGFDRGDDAGRPRSGYDREGATHAPADAYDSYGDRPQHDRPRGGYDRGGSGRGSYSSRGAQDDGRTAAYGRERGGGRFGERGNHARASYERSAEEADGDPYGGRDDAAWNSGPKRPQYAQAEYPRPRGYSSSESRGGATDRYDGGGRGGANYEEARGGGPGRDSGARGGYGARRGGGGRGRAYDIMEDLTSTEYVSPYSLNQDRF